MADTLKSKADLLDALPIGQEQGITGQAIRDLLFSSMGVGAGENDSGISNGTPLGLTRLGGKRFQVDPGGDGIYLFVGQGDADIDIQANVLAGFTVNGVDTTAQYIRRATFTPGDQNGNHIIIVDTPTRDGATTYPLVAGDIVELEFKVTGGAALLNTRYFVFGVRVG